MSSQVVTIDTIEHRHEVQEDHEQTMQADHTVVAVILVQGGHEVVPECHAECIANGQAKEDQATVEHS